MGVDPYGEGFVPEAKSPTRKKVRCARCNRLLAELVTAPWVLRCTRCKAVNKSAPADRDGR